MSGRFCSLAWAVFFPGDAVAVEEAPQRADAEAMSTLGELRLNLLENDFAGLLDQRQDEALMRTILLPSTPSDGARCRNAEAFSRLPTRHAA